MGEASAAPTDTDRPPEGQRARAGEVLGVAVGSVAAAIGFTWPLVLHLQTRARDLIDTLFQAWTIDWVQYAVEHGHNPYNANIFVPQHTTLAYSDTLFGVAIPTLPLRWLGMSPIGVLNVTLLLGFALSAAAAYVFVRMVTGSWLAAAVGGAAYAFGTFGALSARHIHVAMRPGVPLAAAAAWWLADRARSHGRVTVPALALVGVIAWSGTVSFYPAVFAVVTAAVVLLVRCGSLGRRGLVAAGAALLGSAGTLVLLAIPNLQVAAHNPSYHFSLASFGPGDGNFFGTEPGLVVWGHVLGLTPSDTLRNGIFPGATLLVLAVIGAVAAWRARGRARVAAVTGAALVVVGAAMAVGTAATGWRQYAPYRLLYELGPPFNALRDESRGWMIGLCGLGLLAGFGALALVHWVRPRVGRWTHAAEVAVVTALVLLLLLEGYDPWFHRPIARIAPVESTLAVRPAGGVVYLPMNYTAQLDISIFAQPLNLYDNTVDHRPTPNGYSGYIPPSYVTQSRALRALPAPGALSLLRRLGVRYVVVHPTVAGTPWAALRRPPDAAPLRYLGRYGNDLLYEVPPA